MCCVRALPFVCCFLALSVSATNLDSGESYRYIQGLDPLESQTLGGGTCKICSEGSQCFILDDPSRCEYYTEAFQLMQEDDGPGDAKSSDPRLKEEIDDMLYSLTEKALEDPRYEDCVPFVSQYTDCTKDNICTGCRRCTCDTTGTWNCTRVQRCRPDTTKPNVNRHTLITVIDALNNHNTGSRTKRSLVFNQKAENVLSKDNLSYENVGEWMYGVVLRNSVEVKSNTTISNSEVNKSLEDTNSTKVTSPTEITPKLDVTSEAKVNYKTEMYKAEEVSNVTEAFINEISNATEVNDAIRVTNETEITYTLEAMNALDIINAIDIADQIKVSNATEILHTMDGNNLNITINVTMEPDERIDVPLKDMMLTNETELSKISFNEITEWLNEVHPLITNKNIETEHDDASIAVTSEIVVTTPANDASLANTNIVTSITKSDNEIIVFDEVLRSVTVNNKNYTRRKPPLDLEEITAEQDTRNYNEQNITVHTNDDDHNLYANILSAVKVGNSVTENSKVKINENKTRDDKTEPNTIGVTKVVIDLLESKNLKDEFKNDKDRALFGNIDSSSKLTKDMSVSVENVNYAVLNTLNIMKRDVSHVQENITEVTTAKVDNCTRTFQDLSDNVLSPLNGILKDRQKEVEQLLKIRENLITFMRTYEDVNINTDSKDNKTEPEKNRNSFFSIYKLEFVPNFDHDFRRSNTTLLDKYLMKLKRDVYEIIRDIVTIQKLTDKSKLSEGLKFLIRAMKVYVHKQGFHAKHKRNLDIKKETRRNWKPDSVTSLYTLTTHDDLAKILAVIAKKIAYTNGLNPLSYKAKKIITRIIEQNYLDKYSVPGLKIEDPHYNLTKDLRNIGTKWHEKTNDISNSLPSDRLYCMKLLYLLLSTDLSKMNDASSLIDFARSRRMLPVEEDVGQELVMKINMDLQEIHNKIMGIMKIRYKPHLNTVHRLRKSNETESFLRQLKNILKKSKNDILGLLHKQVPKSDIIRMLARKKVDYLTEKKFADYKRTMLKWQDHFNVLPLRGKRSVSYYYKTMRNRIRNILPKYLTRKLHPGMAKSSKRGHVKANTNNGYKRKNTKTTATSATTKFVSATTKFVSETTKFVSTTTKFVSAKVSTSTYSNTTKSL